MSNTSILTLIQQNSIYFYIFSFFVGSCFASFFNVYALRYVKILEKENANEVISWFDELGLSVHAKITELANQSISLSLPASHCYQCHTPLKWYHNIPIFSWIFLKGKCFFCHHPISKQYPIVEFFGGALFFYTLFFFLQNNSDTNKLFSLYLFFSVTYLLLIIDWKTMFLPDELTYFLLWAGILLTVFSYNFFKIDIKESILAAVFSFMFFWTLGILGKLIKKTEVIGGGDLKLIAAIGAFLGYKGVFVTVFLSPFLGIIFYFISRNSKQQFPYGPSLILGSWLYVFYFKNNPFI